MKFFKRDNSDAAAIPEDLQPYYSSQNTGVRRWIGPILRGLVLLVIIALLIWGAIWLIGKFTGGSDDKKPTSSQTAQQKSAAAEKKKAEEKKAAEQKAAQDDASDLKAAEQKTAAQKNAKETAEAKKAQEQKAQEKKAAESSASSSPANENKPDPAATPAPATSPGPAPTPGAAADPNTPVAATGQELANSGPGEVAAIFAAVTALAAILHRFYLIRTLR